MGDGKAVTVETTKRDRYGSEVDKVLAGGLNVNLEQVRLGLAWHYKAYEREQEARAARIGLWTDPMPLPLGSSGSSPVEALWGTRRGLVVRW